MNTAGETPKSLASIGTCPLVSDRLPLSKAAKVDCAIPAHIVRPGCESLLASVNARGAPSGEAIRIKASSSSSISDKSVSASRYSYPLLSRTARGKLSISSPRVVEVGVTPDGDERERLRQGRVTVGHRSPRTT